MVVDTRSRAEKRLAQIEAEFARLNAEAEELRSFIATHDRLSELDESGPDASPAESLAVNSLEDRPFATTDEIVSCAREVLKDETEPMHISHLYRLVVARGIRISGRNPQGNLSAKFAPHTEFYYWRDRGGWILRQNMRNDVESTSKNEPPGSMEPGGSSENGEGDGNPLSSRSNGTGPPFAAHPGATLAYSGM